MNETPMWTAGAGRTRRAPWKSRLRDSLAALLLAGWIAGCGDLTSGGFGEVELQVSSGSAEEAGVTGSLAAAATLGSAARAGGGASEALAAVLPPGFTVGADELEGTLTVVVRAWVRERAEREGEERWIEVTPGFEEIVLPLEDPTPVVLARTELPATEYTAVRAVFGRVRANVVRGLTLDGVPVVGEIQVDLGGAAHITIEEPLALDLARGRTVPLIFEMRADEWLHTADRDQRTVREQDFRGRFRVRIRP